MKCVQGTQEERSVKIDTSVARCTFTVPLRNRAKIWRAWTIYAQRCEYLSFILEGVPNNGCRFPPWKDHDNI